LIDEVVAHLRRGEVVGVPTDTVYGLAVDPHNESAVQRLFALKGRPESKPVSLLVASVSDAESIVYLSEEARDLASHHWPGALTLVARPREKFPFWIGDPATRTVGVRVPDHAELQTLLEVTGGLAVTSANVSENPDTLNDVEARAVFGDEVALYMPGRCPGGSASTVIDVTSAEFRTLRQGPIRL